MNRPRLLLFTKNFTVPSYAFIIFFSNHLLLGPRPLAFASFHNQFQESVFSDGGFAMNTAKKKKAMICETQRNRRTNSFATLSFTAQARSSGVYTDL